LSIVLIENQTPGGDKLSQKSRFSIAILQYASKTPSKHNTSAIYPMAIRMAIAWQLSLNCNGDVSLSAKNSLFAKP
ncbi:MAG: hypothetical protein ACRCX5_03965, partial [Bacteroidales bacterium]